jgi:hypothetical protein
LLHCRSCPGSVCVEEDIGDMAANLRWTLWLNKPSH